jgi:hypothetical protein
MRSTPNVDKSTALLTVARMQGTAMRYPLTNGSSTARAHWSPSPGWVVALGVHRYFDAMGGRPVWVASVSFREGAELIVPTTRWPVERQRQARRYLEAHVRGVGMSKRYRLYRMQVTLCLELAVTDEERAQLPPAEDWQPILAGGPCVLLESRGVPDIPSTNPCKNPTKEPIEGMAYDPELWVPIDCGRCSTCRARLKLEESFV